MTVELCQKRRDVISCFLLADKASRVILDALKNIKKVVIDTREDGIAIINTRHKKTQNEFSSGLVETQMKPRHVGLFKYNSAVKGRATYLKNISFSPS